MQFIVLFSALGAAEVRGWEVVGGRKLRQLWLQWGVMTLSVSPNSSSTGAGHSLFTATSEKSGVGDRQRGGMEAQRDRALG